MSRLENGSLRPLAKTRSKGFGPFGALLTRAIHHPEAAFGLALAYTSFDAEARRRIVEAIFVDARAQGLSVPALLVPLLGVEENADVARCIADAISAEAGIGLQPVCSARVLFAGDEAAGSLVLARPLFGFYLELLALHWRPDEGITLAVFYPLATEENLKQYVADSPAGLLLDEVSLQHAVDLVTPVLLNHRRRFGSLPSAIKPFADIFTVTVA